MRMRGFIALVLVLAGACAAGNAHAEYYTLQKALDVALDVSTGVGISREQLGTARSDVIRAYANWIPNVSVSMWTGHSWAGPTSGIVFDSQGRAIQPTGFDYDSYTFGVSSSLTLFDWGANLNRLTQSKASANAASHDLEYEKDFIRAMVIREYYDLVKQRRLRVVREADVEAQQRNLEQVEAFYRIGSRTKADYLQAQVNLANSELELLNAENAVGLADARLKSRLNLPLQDSIQVDESLETSLVAVNLENELAYMSEHRSDLLAGRNRVAAARAGLSATGKARYPSLSGSFRYNWNDREWTGFEDLFKRNYVWSAGIFLNWDVFDRFMTKSNIQSARASYRVAEYNLEQAHIDASLDVKQIVLNLEQSRRRMELAETTVEQAQENLRLAEERYRVGAGTVLETFQATASLTLAQAQLIEAKVDYLVNQADLQRATGRLVTTP
jgi:outer membrane protein